ncbi:MAG: DNA alkylation repair protein [Endomicrobia bacterium]|nr:DNA alkylation repair protein [Endomicrobiia bacterium]MCL2798665.1 DNA alkylation repair protein [Endomicrobiia bacterium]
MNKNKILKELKSLGDKEFAIHHAKFFQTHKGGYGEGDLFWGLRVPQQRAVAKKYYKDITLKEAKELLQHKIHEARLTALAVLSEKYKKADDKEKKAVVKTYLANTEYINNWDLVDLSAPYIAGAFWFDNPSDDMLELAKSKNLWRERISMVSTLYFIKRGRLKETFELAEMFLSHKHDLMHKAAGWMLREAGKKDISALRAFLDKNHKKMPRTMLRYAIEKFPDRERKKYMGR